jgi:hypothetical protein
MVAGWLEVVIAVATVITFLVWAGAYRAMDQRQERDPLDVAVVLWLGLLTLSLFIATIYVTTR